MTEPRDEARNVLADTLHEELYGPLQPTVMHGETVDCNCYEVADVLAARGYRLCPGPAPDVETLADTLMDLRMDGPWSRPPSELTYQEAMRRYARLLLAALHPADPSRTPEVETWLAIRAALHEAANDKCRDGRFDHCYDQFHSPPVQFAEWWPPADPSRREP